MPIAIFIFIIIPLIELAVMIKVGSLIGVLPTIALLILSAIIGIALVRKEGISTLMKARKRAAAGQSPEIEALESMIIALSGCLMILPGFITDIIGLCGLTPPVRHLLIRRIKKRIHIRTSGHTYEGHSMNGTPSSGHNTEPHQIIEGEFERKNSKPKKKS